MTAIARDRASSSPRPSELNSSQGRRPDYPATNVSTSTSWVCANRDPSPAKDDQLARRRPTRGRRAVSLVPLGASRRGRRPERLRPPHVNKYESVRRVPSKFDVTPVSAGPVLSVSQQRVRGSYKYAKTPGAAPPFSCGRNVHVRAVCPLVGRHEVEARSEPTGIAVRASELPGSRR